MRRKMITGFTVVLGAAIAVFGCAASSPPATTKVEPQLTWEKVGETNYGRTIYRSCHNHIWLYLMDTDLEAVYRPNSGC